MARKLRERKGYFSSLNLPVSGQYLFPVRRRLMIGLGLAALAAAIAYAVLDFKVGEARVLSNGPLSASHAIHDRSEDCAKCHAPHGEIPAQRCMDCHEKRGDPLGYYSYATHYLYRSARPSRIEKAGQEHADREGDCYNCHTEHQGRQANITAVEDRSCEGCHFEDFAADHPEFSVIRENMPDSGALRFPHIKHVRELRTQSGVGDPERSCLYCHEPDLYGKGFQPLSFDKHCSGMKCHLVATEATPFLPLQSGQAPGVETLARIRESGGLGRSWTSFVNPAEFTVVGGTVQKRPVYHRDPWILDNLRRLRRLAYPKAPLADLLAASPARSPRGARRMYDEALATLAKYMEDVRSLPSERMGDELDSLSKEMRSLASRIRDRRLELDLAVFQLGELGVPAQTAASLETLASDLTKPCVTCHRLENLAIQRFEADQGTLHRAEFDHRAHVIHADCLDCHNRLPVQDYLGEKASLEGVEDAAEVQNLPSIETCKTCHQSRFGNVDCVSCHLFHPDKERQADFLRYEMTAEMARAGANQP